MPVKRAFCTGLTGQDGSYLAELLLSKGYEVHGLMRRSSSFSTGRIDHIFDKLHVRYGDVMDYASVDAAIAECQPHEVYHLAAQSHVKVSFDEPVYSVECCVMGCTNVLEVLRTRKMKDTRFYNAASSEMFGGADHSLDEESKFNPRSPYACAKVFTYNLTKMYRLAYDMFACNGILFNHESPRRGETFVTRKITRGLSRIHHGLQEKVILGSLRATRDWGFAGDYVDAMWRIVNHTKPDDFVIATGKSYSINHFIDECRTHCKTGMNHHAIGFDDRYGRPLDVYDLIGCADKAKSVLGWSPTVGYRKLVAMMMKNDMELARQEAVAKGVDVKAAQAKINARLGEEWEKSRTPMMSAWQNEPNTVSEFGELVRDENGRTVSSEKNQ